MQKSSDLTFRSGGRIICISGSDFNVNVTFPSIIYGLLLQLFNGVGRTGLDYDIFHLMTSLL